MKQLSHISFLPSILPVSLFMTAALVILQYVPGRAEGIRTQSGWSNIQQHKNLQAFQDRFGIHVSDRPEGYKQNECDRLSEDTLSDLMDTPYMPQNRGYDWKYQASSIGSPVHYESVYPQEQINPVASPDEMILSANQLPGERLSSSSHPKSHRDNLSAVYSSTAYPLECLYK